MNICVSQKLLSLLLAVIFFNNVVHADDTQNLEHHIKALYIIRLAAFITWPEDPEKTSFKICIDSTDHVANELSRISVNKIKHRILEIVDLSTNPSMIQCDFLYLSEGWVDESLINIPVVTISSQADFAEQGGMIQFYIDKTKVRMKANLQAVNKAGIKLESKLIRLLKIVKQAGEMK